jgi:glycosyltransferase involved in cell wall biosynthesis
VRILHTVAGLWEGTGGPVASVTGLCRALARRHEVCLLTGEGSLHPDVRRLADVVRLRVEPLGPYSLAHWSRRFASACAEEAGRADLVHDHGVWLQTNWASAAAARRATRPLVRSPRGMLSPWALGRSRLRKAVLWRLRERSLFQRAAAVHATSALEAAELTALGIRTPIACIPNGVDTDGEYALASVERLREAEPSAPRRVVFLSRLHPKKGLDLLQSAWEALPPEPSTELVIAGGGDAAAQAAVAQWTRRQRGPRARWIGAVGGDAKRRLLANAFVVVLPSRSENYGMVVAEALAAGTPVIASTATPWTSLSARGCGWTVASDVPSLAAALREALSIDDNARARMGRQAREFVEREHSLAAAAGRFEDLYASLVERGR